MEEDGEFNGFQADEAAIANSSSTKKRKINVLNKSPGKASPSDSNMSSQHSEPTNPRHNSSYEPACLVIIREDKKQIPFNFVNQASKNWDILKCAENDSFKRNNKGTLIKGTIRSNKLDSFKRSSKFFTFKNVKYEAYSPRQFTPHMAELYLDLRDLDDKSILSYNNDELQQTLKTPGDPQSNSILSVDRIYPRKPVNGKDQDTINSCRISIEFSSFVPSRVYFHDVSVPVSPYILPPKRCFNCQRLGHSALSCKRKVTCPNCAGNHTAEDCTMRDERDYKCCQCYGNHRAYSQNCEFYKEALKISEQLQKRSITQEQASKLYAQLYILDKTVSISEEEIGRPRKPHATVVLDSQPPPSVSDFPSLSPNSPSPIIQTSKKLPNQKVVPTNQSTSAETSFGAAATILNQPTQTISQILGEDNQNAPLQSQMTDSQASTSSEDSYIPPAQKPMKNQQNRPTPFHLTSTYSDVVNGLNWELPYSQQFPSNSQTNSSNKKRDSNQKEDSQTAEQPNSENSVNQANSATSPQLMQDSTSPAANGISEFIMNFLKDIANKILVWIKDKLKFFLGTEGPSNLVQSFLGSIFSTSN